MRVMMRVDARWVGVDWDGDREDGCYGVLQSVVKSFEDDVY